MQKKIILHFSFFHFSFSFAKQNCRRASRFARFAGSRRAIRSITRVQASPARGWFRFYPSRKKHKTPKNKKT
jgi:hypothetical protein